MIPTATTPAADQALEAVRSGDAIKAVIEPSAKAS